MAEQLKALRDLLLEVREKVPDFSEEFGTCTAQCGTENWRARRIKRKHYKAGQHTPGCLWSRIDEALNPPTLAEQVERSFGSVSGGTYAIGGPQRFDHLCEKCIVRMAQRGDPEATKEALMRGLLATK